MFLVSLAVVVLFSRPPRHPCPPSIAKPASSARQSSHRRRHEIQRDHDPGRRERPQQARLERHASEGGHGAQLRSLLTAKPLEFANAAAMARDRLHSRRHEGSGAGRDDAGWTG